MKNSFSDASQSKTKTLITLAANIGMWIMRGCSRIASNINSTCINQNFVMSSRTNNPVGSKNVCNAPNAQFYLQHLMSTHSQKTITFVESICSCPKHYICSTLSFCPIPNQKTLMINVRSTFIQAHSWWKHLVLQAQKSCPCWSLHL